MTSLFYRLTSVQSTVPVSLPPGLHFQSKVICTQQFLDDYLWTSDLADEAISKTEDEKVKSNMEAAKENILAVFINSGMADCETLQNVFGPQVE